MVSTGFNRLRVARRGSQVTPLNPPGKGIYLPTIFLSQLKLLAAVPPGLARGLGGT
jgi:hypothetical protein